MGGCFSVSDAGGDDGPRGPQVLTETGESGTFNLLKRRPGCSGMFWRSDPSTSDTAAQLRISKINWPRDGATIRGDVVLVGKDKWLRAINLKQKNEDWMAAPSGAFLPFAHDDHYYLEKDIN